MRLEARGGGVMAGFDLSDVLAAARGIPGAREDGRWRCVVYLSAYDWMSGWLRVPDMAAQSAACKAWLSAHGDARKAETIRNCNAVRSVFRQDYVSVKSKTSFTKRSATFQNTAKVPAEAPSPASSRRASARASSCSSPFRTSPASHGGLSGPSWPSPYRRR